MDQSIGISNQKKAEKKEKIGLKNNFNIRPKTYCLKVIAGWGGVGWNGMVWWWWRL